MTLHDISYHMHRNSALTCIAIHNSLLVCTKSLQYMTIVICHDSRIVMSQNVMYNRSPLGTRGASVYFTVIHINLIFSVQMCPEKLLCPPVVEGFLHHWQILV